MKSRTSFSKLTTFKKDITRYAPIWALYLIGMMLVIFEAFHYRDYDRVGAGMGEMIQAFGIVNLIYAGVIAVMLFGDLYNTRMCYSLHTIPQRRETWLLSHLAAGFLFSLVPNGLAAVYLMVRLEEYWFLALLWLLASELEFLFFFGVATVSALLTGNRFAMLLVYAGINFVSMLAYWVMNTIYLPQMTGVILDFNVFSRLCPVVDLFGSWDFFQFRSTLGCLPHSTFIEYMGLGRGWGYLTILAVIGLALMGLGMLLYRLRHLESAGDFVAFPKLKGVACVIMTVCVTGVFAFFGDVMIGSDYVVWALVGLLVGYFGSLMLLERRIKVFRGKTFIGLAILAAVLVGSFLAVAYDVFGIVEWTPEVRDVRSVILSNYESTNYYYSPYNNRIQVTLEEPEDIENIIDAHEDILARLDKPAGNAGTHRVVLTYKLKDGRTVRRSYHAPASGENYEIISRYFYTPENVLGYTDWDKYVASIDYAAANGGEIPAVMYEALAEALRKDCENGFVTTRDTKDTLFWAEIQTQQSNGFVFRQLAVLPGATNTISLMKTPQMILGYSDWEEYLESVYYVSFSGYHVPESLQQSLLEALRKDCEAGHLTMDYDQLTMYSVDLEIRYPSDSYLYRYLSITKEAEHTLAWLEENEDLLQK